MSTILRYNSTRKQLDTYGSHCTLVGDFCDTQVLVIERGRIKVIAESTPLYGLCPPQYIEYYRTTKRLKVTSVTAYCSGAI